MRRPELDPEPIVGKVRFPKTRFASNVLECFLNSKPWPSIQNTEHTLS